MFDLPQSGGQAAETRADIPLWALLQTSALKRFLRWWFDFINSRDKTFFFFHFKLNQRITETHIFMRILWGKNIPLDSITNQRATLDLCRAARWSFGEKYILYKPFTKVLMHTQRATRGQVHLVSISSIVPAVLTCFVCDLRPVAKIKGYLCLPAYLKTLINSPPGGRLRVYRLLQKTQL